MVKYVRTLQTLIIQAKGGKMKKNKWTYGTHKFKNKKEAVKFLEDNGHSQSWINGYIMVTEINND